jgi:hypothetical protein
MKEAFLIIVFCAFSFSGLYAAKREKRRIDLLGELERLLIFMKSEITLYRRELFDIYSAFESPLLDRSGFSQALGESDFAGAVEGLGLDVESRRAFGELGATLGMLPAEEQKLAIDRCLSTLGNILSRGREEYPKKRKLYISFGLMIGAIIFIIGI